ncbi:MATE family efflux transporter [Desulfobacter curvatus]|uniref:MATE family efflux transporter n=1 Tax=Desulfobacter curvatus TaxID=2290 RepID=UPI00036EC2C6|nr:MATE family efflux transporter [Desulfobacter curvatus]
MKEFILEEPNLRKVMWRLSIPSILGMVLFGINQLIDGIFVGTFVGELALGGVSLSLPLAQMFLGLGSMVGGGAASLLSIALGSKDVEMQHKVLPIMNTVSVLITAMTMLVGLLFSGGLVRMMGGTGALFDFGNAYLRVIVIGAILPIWGLGCNLVIRGEGKMKTAMIMMGIGLATNIVLNYVFIVLLNWGVIGAAWATNAGMLVVCVLGLSYFASDRPSFSTRVWALGFDGKVLMRLVVLGLPSLIMQVMMVIMMLTVYRLIARHGGDADIAFIGAAFRIYFVASLPVIGMMRALQPIVGINFGADLFDRVQDSVRTFWIAMTGILGGMWIVVLIFAVPILSTMLPNRIFSDAELQNFRLFMTALPVLPLSFIAITYFPSVGNGRAANILALARQVVLFIPAAIVCASIWKVNGVYYALFGTDFIISIVSGLMLLIALRRLVRKEGTEIEARMGGYSN